MATYQLPNDYATLESAIVDVPSEIDEEYKYIIGESQIDKETISIFSVNSKTGEYKIRVTKKYNRYQFINNVN